MLDVIFLILVFAISVTCTIIMTQLTNTVFVNLISNYAAFAVAAVSNNCSQKIILLLNRIFLLIF